VTGLNNESQNSECRTAEFEHEYDHKHCDSKEGGGLEGKGETLNPARRGVARQSEDGNPLPLAWKGANGKMAPVQCLAKLLW